MTLPTTPSQTVGPYYEIGLCRRDQSALVATGVRLRGRLLDGDGEPIDGMVEVSDVLASRWGRSGTDSQGWFEFVVEKPHRAAEVVPMYTEGHRHDAPRLDVYVFARGLLKHQLTRVYFPDEVAANAADEVLAALPEEARATLVASAGDDGELRWDIRMQGEHATVFFAV